MNIDVSRFSSSSEVPGWVSNYSNCFAWKTVGKWMASSRGHCRRFISINISLLLGHNVHILKFMNIHKYIYKQQGPVLACWFEWNTLLWQTRRTLNRHPGALSPLAPASFINLYCWLLSAASCQCYSPCCWSCSRPCLWVWVVLGGPSNLAPHPPGGPPPYQQHV